jgi:ferredoxin-NADP reductase/Na+-translocating ferredoxin:NAD+ oxidoreductase RnfD subunit
MMTWIDRFLNTTTMYMVLVYYLGGLLVVATGFSAVGILPYNPLFVITSALFLVAVCWLSNALFAHVWNVPTNVESSIITGLILSLIITPEAPYTAFFFLLWAGVLAMASKYILAIRGKHLLNPAAFGVMMTALFLNQSATWWVGGTIPLLPFILLGGLLVVRKIHRTDLVFSFLGGALISTLAPVAINGGDVWATLTAMVTHTPIFFFAFVMITEPLTTPPRRVGRMLYGGLVGFLFAPWVNIASYYFTPELALIAGNVFSYVISPKFKAVLRLTEIRKLAADTYEFIFAGRLPTFRPGQYAEWTLGADTSDLRGNRRYFTLASSPTENDVRLGVKFYEDPSTFKQYLSTFTPGSRVLVGSIAGDFTLPRRTEKKLVWIAGGIGVTPFRSMAQYLADRDEKRDVVLFYSNKTEAEIAYRDVFDSPAVRGSGVRTVYTLTDKAVPSSWAGSRGYVDTDMIIREVPDYQTRTFFISGPRSMVLAFQSTLRTLGVSRRRIKTDFFPGFA